MEKKQQIANKLRKQLEKVESSIKRKREQQDEGDEMRGSVSPLSDNDSEPEVLSVRSAQPSRPVPPPAKKADVSKHCKYYSTGGTCGKKGKCRFVHDPAVREAAMNERAANNGQLTIRQRLILNDKEQEDLAVLESVQYLLDTGVANAAGLHVSAVKPDDEASASTEEQKPAATHASLPQHPLPAPPSRREVPTTSQGASKPSSSTNGQPSGANLPAPPHMPITSALGNLKGKYQDWNLGGYGKSGVKSDDLS